MASKAVKTSKAVKGQEQGTTVVKCAYCEKPFEISDYGLLCNEIMNHKPVCCFACNVGLVLSRFSRTETTKVYKM